METRLQPGLGSPVPRITLFVLLATVAVLIIGIYWFYEPYTMQSGEQVAIEKPHSTSRSILEAMAQSDPDDPQEQGDDIAVLKDEIAAHPQAVSPAIALSRRLMQAGRYTEAVQELRQVLRHVPTHRGARFQFGSALAAQGHKEEAIQEWRTLVATGDPTWSSIAQGSISRITHPEQPDIAIPDAIIPEMPPTHAVMSIQ